MRRSLSAATTLGQRLLHGAVLAVCAAFPAVGLDGSHAALSSNSYANELASNGIYTFVAAFRNNVIDYEELYVTQDADTAFRRLRSLLGGDGIRFVHEQPTSLERVTPANGPEKRLNIVVVVVESLSADFLGVFGNTHHLTPYLDALAADGILFTNLYATGTRTDRGLEAITLSVPPTPGRSLVKRPGNEDLFSWGMVMREKGYDTKFIYGGYGYFDNMNEFFGRNGFSTVDRRMISSRDIHFENAWGVCDEDLFQKARSEFSASYEKGRPFFAEIMTTSNHRPYTYPAGRIDIPPHTGRSGAVKYTDYAIGKFIEQSRQDPWFRDTLFVIVADHCASSAGRTKLPVPKYHIPLIVYAPAHVRPGRVRKLASQIDVLPTVLGLMQMRYRTKGFGRDIMKMSSEEERAFVSTYQRLGYLRSRHLVVLDAGKKEEFFDIDRQEIALPLSEDRADLAGEAIAYYQGASYLERSRLLQWEGAETVGSSR